MNIKKHIPNLFTLGNLVCGSLAIVMALQSNNFEFWPLLIFIAALLDLFDGAVARAMGVSGELGKQLDSLADVISFGLAPSVIAFKMLELELPSSLDNLKYIAFISVICAALRLAKFNISTDQTTDFSGMPSPPNGIFWASVAMVYELTSTGEIQNFTFSWSIILFLTLIVSLLMVSPVRMFSFKMKGGLLNNKLQLFFLCTVLLAGILSFVLFSTLIPAIPMGIGLYILFSVYYHLSLKKS